MKLSDLRVGEDYSVEIPLATVERLGLGLYAAKRADPWVPAAPHVGFRGTVLEVGLPYGATKAGVRIEVPVREMEVHRRCRCPECGDAHTVLVHAHDHTAEFMVPARAITGRWEDAVVSAQMHRAAGALGEQPEEGK